MRVPRSAESAPFVAQAGHSSAPAGIAERGGIFMALLLAAMCAQVVISGYASPMGGHPDEPAHFLSALMVRDYLRAGLPSSPVTYAQQYYAHHPAIAIGYWPPLFHAVTGVWMLLCGFSRVSVLLLMAVFSAVLQHLLYWFGAKEFNRTQAFLMAAVFPFIPGVSRSITVVMSDVFLAFWCFAATVSFALYLQAPGARSALAFGILTSAAILTKASGGFLLALPLFSVLLSRNFALLRRRSFWAPGLIVAVLCGPWFAWTHELSTRGLLPGTMGKPFFSAWAQYSVTLMHLTGPLVLLAAMIGALLVISRPVHADWYAIVAQPLCVGIGLSLAPVSIETRYCIVAVPSVLLLSAYSLRALLRRMQAPHRLSLVLALVLTSMLFSATGTPPHGRPELASALDYINRAAKPDTVILVSSADAPEVLIVAELAVREPHRPGRITIRANKLLAATDWNTTWYSLRYSTPAEVINQLQRRSVDIVLVGSAGESARTLPHNDLLLRTLESVPQQWRMAYRADGTSGSQYRVYVSASANEWVQVVRDPE